jgi:plastocyanin
MRFAGRGMRAALVVVGTVAALIGATPGTQPTTRLVKIAGFAFAPTEARARVGDTIVWENADILPHTTAADSGRWASAELPVGSTFKWVVADTGRFPYHCAAHPTMRGVLVVR